MNVSVKDEAIKFRLLESPHQGVSDKLRLSVLAELIVIGFLAACAEAFLFYLLSQRAGGIAFLLFLHLGVVVLLSLWVKWRMVMQSGVRMAMLMTISTAFLGAFGAVGTFVSVFVYYFFQRSSKTFLEWYKSIFPDEEDTTLQELHHNLLSGRESPEIAGSVTSFTDVMRRGSTKEKLATIQVINRNFSPDFAPALKMGLYDLDPMIRVQAASAVAALDRTYVNKAQSLLKLHDSRPCFDSFVALGAHYDAYANLGVFDQDRIHEYRLKALTYYMEAHQLNGQHELIRKAIGRLLVKLKRYREAVDWYKILISEKVITSEIVGWVIEGLYYLKAYDELREFIAKHENIIDEENLHENVRSFINLWQISKHKVGA